MNSGCNPESPCTKNGGKEICRLSSPAVNYRSAQECSDGVNGHHERITGRDVGVRPMHLLAHRDLENSESRSESEETKKRETRSHHHHGGCEFCLFFIHLQATPRQTRGAFSCFVLNQEKGCLNMMKQLIGSDDATSLDRP